MKTRIFAGRQCGFGLLETALCTVLAGLFVMGFLTLTQAQRQQSRKIQNDALLTRADLSLVTYAFLHGRLPCPATDGQGHVMASCSPGDSGKLPYRDLGIPDAQAGTIQYTLNGYPQIGNVSANLSVDNTNQLQLLLGQTDLHPAPVLVRPTDARLGIASAPLYGLCSVVTAPIAQTKQLPPAYILQLQEARAANLGSQKPVAGGDASAADSILVINHSFAELSMNLGCPGLMATGARAQFNALVSAQVLLAGLNDYMGLLNVLQQSATADLINGAMAVSVSGPAKVGAKVMNLDIEIGKCTEGALSDCSDVVYAIADLTTESIYEAMNGVKMVRFALNEVQDSTFTTMLSQQIMATLAVQVAQIRRHAVDSVADGAYL